jgi:hypothetical protein
MIRLQGYNTHAPAKQPSKHAIYEWYYTQANDAQGPACPAVCTSPSNQAAIFMIHPVVCRSIC